MAKIIILTLLFCLISMPSLCQEPLNAFYVKSWKKGNTKIKECKFEVELNQNSSDREEVIYDSSGKPAYILVMRHNPLQTDNWLYESWYIDLCEFHKLNRKPKLKSECQILGIGGRGVGDFFPKEDHIGLLYPVEKPEFIKQGILAYPILAKRIIKVEEFYCAIQVTNYKMSQTNPKSLDFLIVTVEFTNTINTNVE